MESLTVESWKGGIVFSLFTIETAYYKFVTTKGTYYARIAKEEYFKTFKIEETVS